MGGNAAGRIATLTYSGEMEIDYEFEADGGITAIKKDAATLTSYTYNAAGRRATRSLANGTVTLPLYLRGRGGTRPSTGSCSL